MIHWGKYPLNVVAEILLRDFNSGKKIFDGDINSVVPRAQKSDDEKISRTRSIAEVFTPPEVVKQMVDALELEKLFWQARVECRCLEAACGEAPFITTRYDAESGEEIPAAERVGILDRKFQAIPADKKKFLATKAVQSVYGYELQGDSLLIARANVLLSFAEFVEDFSADEIREVAKIISKNFWLMDGLKIPDAQGSLFDANEIKITDWFDDEKKYFFTGGNAMKFDFLISNPPYQDDSGSGGNKNFASPIYHHFLREAPKVAEKSVLITPARFLFDAGATPKSFNRDMLNDPHFKVLDYAPDARKYFRNVEIKGGVAITLYDKTKNFGAIGIFTPFEELNSIHQKVCVANKNFKPLSEIMYSRTIYKLTDKMHEDFPDATSRLSKGHLYDMSTNIFLLLTQIFFDDKPNDGHDYIQIFGKLGTERVYKWIRRDYVNAPAPLEKFKILTPDASGSGEFGETLTAPLIVGAGIGSTETFLTIGAFDSRDEAENCLAYIKSKFARAMLGILKVTQHNPPPTWAKVPLQDFSAASDIDWRCDVDGQLYRKYNLSDTEINFIDSHVKEMN